MMLRITRAYPADARGQRVNVPFGRVDRISDPTREDAAKGVSAVVSTTRGEWIYAAESVEDLTRAFEASEGGADGRASG